MNTQRATMTAEARKLAEIYDTWLHLLPTLTRRDLERLIAKRPALWGRFSAYLTSGHVFADESAK